MKATNLESSEVLKAFNRCLADVSKYQNTVEAVHHPAGRITIKGIRYAVTVKVSRVVDGEKEKENRK